jgi:hypothetical protein
MTWPSAFSRLRRRGVGAAVDRVEREYTTFACPNSRCTRDLRRWPHERHSRIIER